MEDTEEAADTPNDAEIPEVVEDSDARELRSSPDTAVTAAPPAGLPAAQPAPRARRRGRTAALLGAAAVLGLVAGTCVGYLAQADREPTTLPSLSQPTLAQAAGEAPEPLSAARDRRVRTDGDLRKLLLRKPGGAKDVAYLMGEDGWADLADYAGYHKKPGAAFGELGDDEFRRAALTGWRVGSTYTVEIRLIQYRQEEVLAAADRARGAGRAAEEEDGTDSWAVPGTGDGMAYVHNRPETKPGYLPVYTAEAHAWRGDIALEIWITDTKPIPKAKIMDLAERQMERL